MSKGNQKKANDFAAFVASRMADKVETQKIDARPDRKYFLIVSEGQRTEPIYFEYLANKLPKHLVNTVTVNGVGANTVSVVKKAVSLRNERLKKRELPPYDEVWAVYDKDDFPAKNFHEAIDLATREGINSGHSNESFELWYVLHFEYLQSKLKRTDYIKKLSGYLGAKYAKNSAQITKSILEKGDVKQAMARAVKLEDLNADITPAEACPSTKVYILVERLMAWIDNRVPSY